MGDSVLTTAVASDSSSLRPNWNIINGSVEGCLAKAGILQRDICGMSLQIKGALQWKA